jgi:hypothetical protein
MRNMPALQAEGIARHGCCGLRDLRTSTALDIFRADAHMPQTRDGIAGSNRSAPPLGDERQ